MIPVFCSTNNALMHNCTSIVHIFVGSSQGKFLEMGLLSKR